MRYLGSMRAGGQAEPAQTTSVDLIRRGYDALSQRNEARLLDCIADEVELETIASGKFVGHDGIKRWLADMDQTFDDWSVAVDEIREIAPHKVLLSATVTIRSHRNREPVTQRMFVVWEVRGEKVVRGTHFTDEAAALAHLGD